MGFGTGRVRSNASAGRSGTPSTASPPARQHQKLIGPAWTGRGRRRRATSRSAAPRIGCATGCSTDAQRAERLARGRAGGRDVRRGGRGVPALRRAGSRLQALDDPRLPLAAERPPAAGVRRRCAIEDITEREIERWRAGLSGHPQGRETLSNKTKNHQLVLMHAIFRRAVKLYGLPRNPLANVDRYRVRRSGDIEVFSPEEVWSLVRAAASEIDGAIFLTAAFTGLRRGELLGLRWRDVDFDASTIRVRASYAAGKLTTPKSGKVRAVPMAPDVAVGARADRPARAVHRRRRLRVRRRIWDAAQRRRAQLAVREGARGRRACADCGSTT